MLFRLRHLRFLPTPLALCLFDWTVTLLGQPPAYWNGDAVNEISPEVYRLLAIGVAAYAMGLVFWVAIFTGLLLLLPRSAALVVAVGVTIGHTAGATSWLNWLWRESAGYQAGNVLCLAAALGLVATIRWEERGRPAAVAGGDRWKWVRWPLVAVLAGIWGYAFVWPH